MGPKRLFPVLAAAACAVLVVVFAMRLGGNEEERSGARPGAVGSPDPDAPVAADLVAAELPASAAAEGPAPAGRVALEAGPDPREATREPQAPEGLVVRGTLVDAASGLPLAGVEVTGHAALSGLARVASATGAGERALAKRRAVSGADGAFALAGLEPGQVDLAFRLAGYAPLDRRGATVPDVEVHDLGVLQLAQGAILVGRVVDANGGPVAGAELRRTAQEDGLMLFGPSRDEPLAVTNEAGEFRIEHLACGPWTLLVTHDDHPAGLFRGEANDPGRTVGGLLFRLRPAATIAGRIVDVDPAVLPHLRVRATPAGGLDFLGAGSDPAQRDRMLEELAGRRRDVEPDASGAFELRGLTAGNDYRLEAYRAGRGMFFGGSAAGSVVAKAGDRGVELPYRPLGTLVFQVVDAETRQPLSAFTVRTGGRFARNPLLGPDGKTLKHHPDGVVRVDGLPTGADRRTSLFVEATGYAEFRRDGIELAAGEVLDLGVVALPRISLVRVQVVEESSGEPVAGARVTLSKQREPGQEGNVEISIEMGPDDEAPILGGGDVRRATTDAEGWVSLNSFEGELATLRVESEDHAPWELTDWPLPRGESVERRVELLAGGRALVSVLDAGGVRMPGVRVQHRPPSAGGSVFSTFLHTRGAVETDGEGVAVFDHLAPGVHGFKIGTGSTPGVFELDGGGGAFVTADVHVAGVGLDGPEADPWTEVTVLDGETHEVELWADALGGLSGRVREAGVPLAGAVLSLKEKKDASAEPWRMGMAGMMGGPKAKTDGDGRYAFEEVKAGRYELSVSHPSRALPARFEVEVEEGGTSFDVELSVSILAGRVTAPSGEPLPGVKVEAERAPDPDEPQVRMASIMVIEDGSHSGGAFTMSTGDQPQPTYTDADGRYELRGVPADVELIVRASGATVQTGTSEAVEVRPGEVRDDVDLVLQPAGRLEVAVVDARGEPVRLCLVSAEPVELEDDQLEVDPRDLPRSMTNPQGIATLSGLAPGLWLVEAQSFGETGGQAEPLEVAVEAGENEQVTIRMP